MKKARLIKPKSLKEKLADSKLIVDSEGNILGNAAPEVEKPAQDHNQAAEQQPKQQPEQQADQAQGQQQGRKKQRASKKGDAPKKEYSEEERTLKESDEIASDFELLKQQLEAKVGLNISFDVVFREMVFGGVNTGIFYYNGFAKDEVLTQILQRLSYADRDGHIDRDKKGEDEGTKLTVVELFETALIPHVQVEVTDKLKEAVEYAASGGTTFFFEGETKAVLVDAKTFPSRSTEEPDLERVVRGSRDGFVETLLTNVTLLRRRLRDPRLRLDITKAGKRTKSDICVAYIDDICDKRLVKAIRDKIDQVDVDGLPLAEKQLEEIIVAKGWDPYPLVRYSERPDVVAAHLLEGHICVFVDTSPSVMILPATFFHHVQHAEEYRQTPTVGTYLRWVRFLGIAASLFLLPMWYLMAANPALKPEALSFIGPNQVGQIPLIIQFFIAELGIDMMRMAAVHTPTPLATAMGLVAAILIGDIAVKTGLFSNEVILYLAVAAIGTFATPSYELSLANRLSRLIFLAAAAIFSVPGLIAAVTLWLIALVAQRSYNAPYMWPFIPFNAKAMMDIILRRSFRVMNKRLSLTKPVDTFRKPSLSRRQKS